jgi:aspartate/tyrosine/aromatic aminotransferase
LFQAFGAQTLSGSGALRLGAEFLVRHLQYKTLYMSAPTWGEYYNNYIKYNNNN